MSIMRSTDFKAVVEPILNEGFDGVYDQRKDEWKGLFHEQAGLARAYQEEYVQYGFAAAPELPDGTPVSYQSGGVLFTQRYVRPIELLVGHPPEPVERRFNAACGNCSRRWTA